MGSAGAVAVTPPFGYSAVMLSNRALARADDHSRAAGLEPKPRSNTGRTTRSRPMSASSGGLARTIIAISPEPSRKTLTAVQRHCASAVDVSDATTTSSAPPQRLCGIYRKRSRAAPTSSTLRPPPNAPDSTSGTTCRRHRTLIPSPMAWFSSSAEPWNHDAWKCRRPPTRNDPRRCDDESLTEVLGMGDPPNEPVVIFADEHERPGRQTSESGYFVDHEQSKDPRAISATARLLNR